MPIKITTKSNQPALSLFWQRLIAFITVAGVLFLAAWLFEGEPSIKAMVIGAVPALVAWFTGKLYAEPLPAVTERALMSMRPERAELIIENRLRSMQPDIAAAIAQRASHPPPLTQANHGSEETQKESRRESSA